MASKMPFHLSTPASNTHRLDNVYPVTCSTVLYYNTSSSVNKNCILETVYTMSYCLASSRHSSLQNARWRFTNVYTDGYATYSMNVYCTPMFMQRICKRLRNLYVGKAMSIRAEVSITTVTMKYLKGTKLSKAFALVKGVAPLSWEKHYFSIDNFDPGGAHHDTANEEATHMTFKLE